MNKDFAPYEEALALKELGFDEPCLTCYDKLEMIASHSKNVFDYKNYNTSGYMVSRPTFSQAFKWLYQKLDIEKGVMPLDTESQQLLLKELIDKVSSKHLLV